jgi:2-oxoglutarate dehydrogenase E2 component (dihydrolipoamide succinyltransferase)
MSGTLEIRAPEEQTEGTRSQLLRWLKSVGETVQHNEPLVEIETDKVTVEIASPGSGVLREVLKQEQEEIAPGDLLGRIETVAATADAPMSRQQSESAADALPTAAGRQSPHPPTPTHGDVAGVLSPAVRRLIAEHALEASAIQGTGGGSRITIQDVLQHVARLKDHGSAPSSPTVGAPLLHSAGTSRRVAHTAVRRRIAEHMVQSLLHTAPHVTTVFEANLASVLRHREQHGAQFAQAGAPLTLTAYFLEASTAAIRAVPEANSRWTDTELEIFESVHIGVATALDTGLMVPVLRDVQSRELIDIARGLNDLVARAREGRLAPADVRGGTFTISNHGVSGSLFAAPIVINQPQAAILGIGKLEKRAVVAGAADGADRIVIEPRCYVTLTIDHRVMDGQQANRFLAEFVRHLETYRV